MRSQEALEEGEYRTTNAIGPALLKLEAAQKTKPKQNVGETN